MTPARTAGGILSVPKDQAIGTIANNKTFAMLSGTATTSALTNLIVFTTDSPLEQRLLLASSRLV